MDAQIKCSSTRNQWYFLVLNQAHSITWPPMKAAALELVDCGRRHRDTFGLILILFDEFVHSTADFFVKACLLKHFTA